MYNELLAELRMHHCNAKEDDTQEVCEECAYDVIIADKSVPSGIASVCVCGLMHRAADAIEELNKCLDGVNDAHNEGYDVGYWAGRRDYEPKWIPVEILPEPYEEVLVYLWKDKPYLASIDSTGEWCASDFIIDVDDMPNHWMRLPEPPKGDE